MVFSRLLLLALLGTLSACTAAEDPPRPAAQAHPYITDEALTEPTLFQEGIVSTNIDKFNTSFSPDGITIYYTATSRPLGLTGIAYQTFEAGVFQEPQFVPFVSAADAMTDVQLSPEGDKLFFSTFRGYEGKPKGFQFNLWVSARVGDMWQDPTPLEAPVNSASNEFYPVPTANGTLYFNSDRSGNPDIYFSRYEDGAYQEPVRLPDNVNSPQTEADAFIARDESYLIFVRVDAEDGQGNSDLYISFNEGNGEWTDPHNLGARINTPGVDGSPYVTPDGNYLFFTSDRQREGLKAAAMTNYASFKATVNSSQNGSLNFYYLRFNPDDYRP